MESPVLSRNPLSNIPTTSPYTWIFPVLEISIIHLCIIMITY